MATRTRVSWVLRVMSAVRMSGLDISGFKTVLGADGMCGKPFAAGQYGCHAAQRLRSGPRYHDHAGSLLEVIDAQRRREASRAGRGQHVVGACAVVAERLRSIVAEEDGAGVADPVRPAFRTARF